MKKLLELINNMYNLEKEVAEYKDDRFVRKLKFQQKEAELFEKRNKKLEEAKNFMRRMDIATGWSSENHRLIVDFLREDRKLEDKIAEVSAKLDGIKNAIRERGKKLSGKVHISHGMMAEALTKYFEDMGWLGEWKVMRVHPYLFNEQSACAEYRFGTYIVSSGSGHYLDDEIYTMNDPAREFPLEICVGFGKGDSQSVQIAQDKLDKINWFDIYLQDIVGGMDIPKHLAVFKNRDSEYWEFIQDAFRTIVLESSEFELNEEDEQE